MTAGVTARPELTPTRCAICGTLDAATEVYAANFDPAAFNARVFSARRMPDRIHYRIVRCDSCGLVRSDPVVDRETLARLYAASEFTYDQETKHLKRTYGRYLARAVAELRGRRERLLEIGCGNGFFLEETLDQGFTQSVGLEPSAAAVGKASPAVRSRIVRDIMRPGLFAESEFDVVCMFQVLDHIPDPAAVIDECLRVLRPGGVVLALNHDARSWSARLLGERSPIIDLEHTYLYDRTTMRRIFAARGFEVTAVEAVRNTYSLGYVSQLLPLPKAMKHGLLAALRSSVLGRPAVTLPLGNLCLIGRKPVK